MEESIAAGLVSAIRTKWNLTEHEVREYSPLTLAYIGDSIFDLVIRTYLVEQGNMQVNKLHKRASEYVRATAQKEMVDAVSGLLTEEELSVLRRGKNAKSFSTAKNATVREYHIATGFEALLGYLYLTEQYNRILELTGIGMERVENKVCDMKNLQLKEEMP